MGCCAERVGIRALVVTDLLRRRQAVKPLFGHERSGASQRPENCLRAGENALSARCCRSLGVLFSGGLTEPQRPPPSERCEICSWLAIEALGACPCRRSDIVR